VRATCERSRARARVCVCVCVSREDGGDAKNREARKKCASAPAKWKHFFDRDGRQSTVTLLPRWSLRFLKSRAPIRCNKMSAKSGDGARDVRAGRLKAERLNPSGAGRELARRAVLWRQREILSWKLKPQFKCPCLSLSLSLSLSRLFQRRNDGGGSLSRRAGGCLCLLNSPVKITVIARTISLSPRAEPAAGSAIPREPSSNFSRLGSSECG